ncbi:SDR family oxidoreductase, partial [Actinoplanes sp. NPDC051411]|uniref:SDR family NAD(P)-dependent oxidoreductase n=1 Tax=Actinoplanes sp. NPDC051411 TaxID=3155522 RepID=UPI003439716A
RAEPGRAEPGRAEPGRGEPGRGEPGRGEPGRGEPGRGEPAPLANCLEPGSTPGRVEPALLAKRADPDLASGRAEQTGPDLVFRADVSDPQANLDAVAATVSRYGRLDLAVLNAGIPGRCGLDDFTVDGYRATMGTNLDGVVFGLHACRPHLRGHGSVTVIASIAGLTGSPDVFYATSKHALIGLVRSAAPALAAEGIRINALCPGLVDTPALASLAPALRARGFLLADPAEVADAAEVVLADERTGLVWTVQAGKAAYPAELPELALPGG